MEHEGPCKGQVSYGGECKAIFYRDVMALDLADSWQSSPGHAAPIKFGYPLTLEMKAA
jgi:hypothetical protein